MNTLRASSVDFEHDYDEEATILSELSLPPHLTQLSFSCDNDGETVCDTLSPLSNLCSLEGECGTFDVGAADLFPER